MRGWRLIHVLLTAPVNIDSYGLRYKDLVSLHTGFMSRFIGAVEVREHVYCLRTIKD